MSAKRLSLSVMILLALFVGTGFAQTIYVAQCAGSANCDERAQYKTIQEAVNRAQPGWVIQILDTEIYNEQVTIDGRETSPWTAAHHHGVAVVGGKNGITLRYVPPAGSTPNGNWARPTIRHRDIQNTSPRSRTEAQNPGEVPGTSGNFETSGALRILSARNVTIDGLAVDGVSAFPFGADGVWCPPAGGNCHPLFHGNAAITLAVSGGTIIKNCDIKGGYFGINVKDRNTGGVYGNPNPADNDVTVPLSGFGTVGNHLFEYNRIHNNSVAVFFESAWDLGSTVRYNLIYSNKHTTLPTIEPNNQSAGAFLFKDMYLTPIAIYNNTLYDNTGNFLGNWQIGGQHLIFNNIFSRSRPSDNPSPYMVIDARYPNRMHNSVFSANIDISIQCQDNFNCSNDFAPNGCFVNDVRLEGFTNPTKGSAALRVCNNGTPTGQTQSTQLTQPGASIPGAEGAIPNFPAGANVRWLQTEGGRVQQGSTTVTPHPSLPPLFLSVDPANANFLVPDWNHPYVVSYIKNQGWVDIGVRNSDGSIADLGAIPSTGRQQTTLTRIVPVNVVLISGGTARADVRIEAINGGEINNPTISFLRWIAPLPENNVSGKDWANNFDIVPATSIRDLTSQARGTAVTYGRHQFSFNLGNAAVPKYGFFEVVISGTDANGNAVTSDVAFLPYRELTHFLDIEVHALTGTIGSGTRLTEVKAGEVVRLRVSAREGNAAFPHNVNEITYSLSDVTTNMLCVGGQCPAPISDRPLTYDTDVERNRTYQVVFTKAGLETIMGAGLYVSGSNRLSLLGITDILVRPGDPEKLEWKNPVPKASLGGGLPQIINRGANLEVTVEVQDKFGNAVDVATQVNIVSNDAAIGDAGAPGAIATKNVMTSAATGLATFNAVVTNGVVGQTFDMTATLALNGATDVGSLRIGRTLDMLQVFYADTGSGSAWRSYYDPTAEITGQSGQWFQITVKAVSPDTVISTKNGCVFVEPPQGIIFSATQGGAEATTFPMTAGVARFWVSSAPGLATDITDACLDVYMRQADCSTQDNGIQPGNRCGISFIKPTTSVLNAVVFGDGQGRPDTVYVRFSLDAGASYLNGTVDMPDSVLLKWPTVADPGVMARGSRITAVNDSTLRVDFRELNTSLGTPLPTGHTSIASGSLGLVTLYGGVEGSASVSDLFTTLDGVGPVIADSREMISGRRSPEIVENLNPGVTADTIILQLSEQIFDEDAFVGGSSIFYSQALDPPEPATGGTPLNIAAAVVDILGGGFKLVLAPNSPVPAVGNWIRINPASSLRDIAANASHGHASNAAHMNNRWVQVRERATPPDIVSAYYTSNDAIGFVDYAYITFNKEVRPLEWFTDGSIRFQFTGSTNADNVAVGADPGRFLELVNGEPNVLRVDLSFFPGLNRGIMTGGGMNVTVGFSPSLADWVPLTAQVVDRASPVLADTVLLKIGAAGTDGAPDAPDTLVIVYSEALSTGALSLNQPVIIQKLGGREIPVTLGEPVVSLVSGTSFQRVTYVITTPINPDDFPVTGDRVFINPLAGLADGVTPPNVQESQNNLRQPLKVERGPLKWGVTITNNPYMPGHSDASRVTLSPNVKGGKVEITAHIRLYNNMGNVVVDTLLEKVDNVVNWTWDGYNRKGRQAGTGTYLMRATCNAIVFGADLVTEERRERYTVQRSMGVVRGKK
ncbi:MAG: hypothetical protein FWB94_01130 [Chitinispirillia bacterium]|nr:hypothetical protein [Chitinispirillia bacterium]